MVILRGKTMIPRQAIIENEAKQNASQNQNVDSKNNKKLIQIKILIDSFNSDQFGQSFEMPRNVILENLQNLHTSIEQNKSKEAIRNACDEARASLEEMLRYEIKLPQKFISEIYDLVYQTLVTLTEVLPRNNTEIEYNKELGEIEKIICPLSLEEINPSRSISLSTGFQFNYLYISSHFSSGKHWDPMTRIDFNKRDIKRLERMVSQLKEYNAKLLMSVNSGEINKIKQYLELGADINSTNGSLTGLTPLHLAVKNGNLDIVNFLVKAQADLETKTKSGDTPLHLAIISGKIEIIQCLIDAETNINVKNNFGITPIDLVTNCKTENEWKRTLAFIKSNQHNKFIINTNLLEKLFNRAIEQDNVAIYALIPLVEVKKEHLKFAFSKSSLHAIHALLNDGKISDEALLLQFAATNQWGKVERYILETKPSTAVIQRIWEMAWQRSIASQDDTANKAFRIVLKLPQLKYIMPEQEKILQSATRKSNGIRIEFQRIYSYMTNIHMKNDFYFKLLDYAFDHRAYCEVLSKIKFETKEHLERWINTATNPIKLINRINYLFSEREEHELFIMRHGIKSFFYGCQYDGKAVSHRWTDAMKKAEAKVIELITGRINTFSENHCIYIKKFLGKQRGNISTFFGGATASQKKFENLQNASKPQLRRLAA